MRNKKLKSVLALVLVLAMAMTFSVTAFAGAGSFSVNSTTLTSGVLGQPYSCKLDVTADMGTKLTYTYVSGLPAGLSFDPATATISGTIANTASTSESYTVLISIDSQLMGDQWEFTLTVVPAASFVVNSTKLDTGIAGKAYSCKLDVTEGTDAVTYSYVSGLPAGLTFDPATATISGTLSATAATGSPYSVVIGLDNGRTGDEWTFKMYVLPNGVPYYVNDSGDDVFLSLSAVIYDKWMLINMSGKSVSFKDNTKTFNDISGHWAESYIQFATERQMFAGTGTNTFSPDTSMTRAMLVTVMYKIYVSTTGETYTSGGTNFSDVPGGAWFETAVKWASANDVVSGVGNNMFNPNGNVTRQEMAVMLYKFATVMGFNPRVPTQDLRYPDASSIASWAQNVALWCQDTGIISGREGGNFVPNGTATRAEVATVMRNFTYFILTDID